MDAAVVAPAVAQRGRKSKRAKRQEFDNMAAPTIGGATFLWATGNQSLCLVELPDRLLRTRLARTRPALSVCCSKLGEMVTATESVNDDTRTAWCRTELRS